MPHRIRTRPASTGRGSFWNLTRLILYRNTKTCYSIPLPIHFNVQNQSNTKSGARRASGTNFNSLVISNIIKATSQTKTESAHLRRRATRDNRRLADTASDLIRGPSENYRMHDSAPRLRRFFSFCRVRGGRAGPKPVTTFGDYFF